MDAQQISIPALMKWGGTFIAAQWLRVPTGMQALVIFMALDYTTGLISAYIRKELSSQAARNGLLKKVLVVLLLLAAHFAEKSAGIELHLDTWGALAYMVNELISIVENVAKAGVPIPTQLVSALMTMKKIRLAQASQAQLAELNGEVEK